MRRTVTLGEGRTPLVESSREPRLYFKLESANPSGSYKDRFVAGELQRVLDGGGRACVATSSGNTGSALAAACARCDVACTIVVNEAAPEGKLRQMQAHGARVIRVPGFTVQAAVTAQVLELLEDLSRGQGIAMVVSAYRYCPVGMSRVEAIATEILELLPAANVFVPVGGGGLFSAVSRGAGASAARVFAVQPEGCNTVVSAWREGRADIDPVASTTRISGLAVPFDIDASLAVRQLRQRNDRALTVTDAEVFDAQRYMLAAEGIYCEPAAAAALAGARKARAQRWIGPEDDVVCLVTGHGFKDPDSIAVAASAHPDRKVDAGALRDLLMAEVR